MVTDLLNRILPDVTDLLNSKNITTDLLGSYNISPELVNSKNITTALPNCKNVTTDLLASYNISTELCVSVCHVAYLLTHSLSLVGLKASVSTCHGMRPLAARAGQHKLCVSRAGQITLGRERIRSLTAATEWIINHC